MNEITIKNILAEELLGNRICESIEDQQIVDFFYKEFLLEKFLWGEPISVPELRKLLRKKIVNFEFIKLDGEVRPAKGTTMMKYIPPKDHPKGIRPSSPKVATFFDLDKDAWRSVSKRSKEIVIKKDEETGKPIIVVKDAPKVKVKVVSKERESTDPIEQGKSYKYTTNRGTNTEIEIVRELPNGLFQVSSPLFKTTFAIDPNRIGNEFTPKEPEEEPKVEPTKPKEEPKVEPKEPVVPTKPTTEPTVDVQDVEPIEKKPEEPKKPEKKPEPTPAPPPQPKAPVEPPTEEPTTVIIPNIPAPAPEPEEQTKAPPADITPPAPGEEDDKPEELEK